AGPRLAVVAIHQPGIRGVWGQSVDVEYVVWRVRRRIARAPDRQRRQPGVHLQRMWPLVGLLDEVLESVKARRKIGIIRARLERFQVVGVTALSDLDKQRV